MIADPINDHQCLAAITDAVRAKVAADEIGEIADRFETTDQLIAWIRTLPHRPDTADPIDGPKVACDVPQRFRLPTGDGNCVERSGLFLAVAERIDPVPVRRLATVQTPKGRHTFPVEDGQPVVLDAQVPRNALCAGVDAIDRAAGRAQPLTFADALTWIVCVAEEPAMARPDGVRKVRRAQRTVAAVLDGRAVSRRDLEALLWCCAIAEREAMWWGGGRARVVERTVAQLARQMEAAGPRDRVRIELRPVREILGSVGRIAGRVAPPLAFGALRAGLARYGVPPELVDQVAGEIANEQERVQADHAGRRHRRRSVAERVDELEEDAA